MRILAFAGRLFNIRSDEWPRLALLYCMSLATLTGAGWGDAIVQAAFLQRVGVQYLPWVFISSAACSLAALFVYSAFADRISNTRLLIALLAISGAGILIGLALLAGGLVRPAYLFLYLVLNVPLLDVYNVHWATYVNSFYDIRAAKRIVPVLGTSARLAGIIGGLGMPVLNRLLSPAAIIGLAVVALGVMAILAAAMPRLLGERRNEGAASPDLRAIARAMPGAVASGAGRSGPDAHGKAAIVRVRGLLKETGQAYGGSLREGYRQIAASPFLGWMAVSTLSMTLLLVMVNYQASAIFLAELKTTVQISNYLGVLGGIANLVVLPIQLLLLSRLITRLGLGNASLIFPLASLAAAGGLVMAPGLATATLGFLDRTALRTAFRLPTENLLYNAVPLRVKARTRAFVGGLVVPLGTILGGLVLLTPLKRTAWFLPAAILVLALALALAGLQVRRHYARALLALLEDEDYSSLTLQAPSMEEPSLLPAADAGTLARLAEKLAASPTAESAVFMARLIVEIGGEAGASILCRAARAATDARLRASLVDVLAAAGVRGAGVRELYGELLADPNGQVRLSAAGGLERIAGPGDNRYLAVAARLLADPEIAVRLRVLPALLEADDPACRSAGDRELRALLNASDGGTRAQALQVVGQAGAAGFLPEVVVALADRGDEVRLAAALAAEALTGPALPGGQLDALLAPALGLLHDPIERVRLACVTILGRLGREDAGTAPAAAEGLASALADPSREVREQAVEALVGGGRTAVQAAQAQLKAADPQRRKMASVALARLEPRTYASLIRGPGLTGNLLAIYQNLGCLQGLAGCPGPAVAILGRALRERNAALLDEIFYLLATIQEPSAVKTIANALHSPQPLTRANATEALESLTSPQTAALVAPLFEPDLPSGQLLRTARQTWELPEPTAAGALRLLLGDTGNAWLCTLAAAALAELSAAAGPLSETETGELLGQAQTDADAGVRAEVRVTAMGLRAEGTERASGKETQQARTLTLVQRLIFVQEMPFFQGMTVDQLHDLASLCDTELIPRGAYIFDEGDMGAALYLVIEGQVALEQRTRTGGRARLAVIDAHGSFGESNLFDGSPRSTAAVAAADTLTLRLRREPLIELAGRHPDISLELINVLAQRLREANDQIGGVARSHPRRLHRLFDSLEENNAPEREPDRFRPE